MQETRTGIGFDAHRFTAGRRLVLGGVTIPFAQGLEGHSDADVLTHAVMDALLGAVADGDIGMHFPDRDPVWKDADSLAMLVRVVARLAALDWVPVNVDVTVIAEAPRLGPHRDRMRDRLGDALRLDRSAVSVKATTVEGMGALGRREGIAALATVLVRRAGPVE